MGTKCCWRENKDTPRPAEQKTINTSASSDSRGGNLQQDNFNKNTGVKIKRKALKQNNNKSSSKEKLLKKEKLETVATSQDKRSSTASFHSASSSIHEDHNVQQKRQRPSSNDIKIFDDKYQG